MPVPGGQETQVLKVDLGANITFGVTAKGIYFSPDSKTIQFLDTGTGKIRVIATLDKHRTGRICVSQDDSYVVWAQTDRDSMDITLVDGFR